MPRGCRLTPREWTRYLDACERGRLFFVYGEGLFARLNRWWQSRRLGGSWRTIPSHVGIVGAHRVAIESMPWRGPTRDFSVDRYLVGRGRMVMIGDVRCLHDGDDVERAHDALRIYMTRMPRRGYDYLSLLSYGRWQINGKTICSELAQVYVNDLCRRDTETLLGVDELILSGAWLARVTPIWRG